MVLCQILGVLVGVTLLGVLDVDVELGQVAIVVIVVFVVHNGVVVVIVFIFAAAAAAWCCCSHCPRRVMTMRQAVAAVVPAQHGGLRWSGGISSGDGGCTTCLHTALDRDAYHVPQDRCRRHHCHCLCTAMATLTS
jgi:hypothetical protein